MAKKDRAITYVVRNAKDKIIVATPDFDLARNVYILEDLKAFPTINIFDSEGIELDAKDFFKGLI